MSKVRPAEPVTQTAIDEIKPATEPEPALHQSGTGPDETGLTLADEVEVTPESRGMSWTIISVFIGISVAAAGIAVLKMTKVI
jgi:hypothetical protein